jgi:electron transfer flavoprotein alpha subunit
MARILVLAELDHGRFRQSTLSAVSFAREATAASGGDYDILVLGDGVAAAAEDLRAFGAASVLVAEHPALQHPLAEPYASLVVQAAQSRGASLVVGAASTFAKDILPRAAALLDAAMVSDVVAVQPDGADWIFKRVLFAGNALATVKVAGAIKCITVRAAAFPVAAKSAGISPLSNVPVDATQFPAGVEFVSREERAAGRPDATEARVVVSGGRALKNAEDFERLVGGLADVLGAAVGSSRALVDSGITANSLQIGQTGKVVAPDLYIAVGISGAIQHMAGMKDTKVIVAINKDPDAPIFEVADYGLVADVYTAVPELTEKLKAR